MIIRRYAKMTTKGFLRVYTDFGKKEYFYNDDAFYYNINDIEPKGINNHFYDLEVY